jgi:hypothetical protein
MAASWQITCISRSSVPDPYERIEMVGGPDGEGWTLRVDEIVEQIGKGARFWVEVDGQQVDVIITRRSGRTYIKARCDRDIPDSLLSLPECVD